MTTESSIQVNFGRPMPLFPLDSVTLLPQQIAPFHVFEPRYRQMIDSVLDTSGQIAMAVFSGPKWKEQYHGRPPLKPAVCVGQIVEHEKLDDGRYNILVQGVCRARILKELPVSEDRLYRVAMLEPFGLETQETDDLADLRRRLSESLAEGPLAQMRVAKPMLDFLRNPEIPTAALLEVISFTILTDNTLRYKLLSEESLQRRADLIERELHGLEDLIRRAAKQRPQDWPKGCSWN
ncbi:MAG: LON peptidase substrate-binding domain-containing protein [Phycisphaerales bacterium]|nr:LON peptidase substrate-binding domain-containing protein [Phycisphaerales bacterium]